MRANVYRAYGPPDVSGVVAQVGRNVTGFGVGDTVVGGCRGCYTLGQAADAMRYLEAGHPRGKVVVTLGPEGAWDGASSSARPARAIPTTFSAAWSH